MKKRVRKAGRKAKVAKKSIKAENVCDIACENKVLCWIPRILGMLFIVFISLFALDAFSEGSSIGEQTLGFIIHLIPSLILVALLIISWRCEKLGGWLYIILGIIFTAFFETYDELVTFLVISGPIFLTGILFLISGMRNSKK
jgi:flagellar biosynthesis protein FliQ